MRSPNRLLTLMIFTLGMITLTLSCTRHSDKTAPHIIYILADDMGYGDVSAMNPEAAWETKHIDRIAREGIRFTDAHTGSAVCTPTRYGVLTGRYSWRTRLKEGVLWSWDEPLIQQGETTVGSLLQEKGYTTACIGKWHLGLGWQYHAEKPDSADFAKPVRGGPITTGFDYFFGITASLDIPPYVYIENDRPTMVPLKYTRDTSEYGWWRSGLTGDDFVHEEVLPVLTQKAVAFIDNHMTGKPDDPFFLYFPLPAPHTPILPTDQFRGKSGTNPYGDFVLQVDHTVGQILQSLEAHGIADNTLIIFTSDNGCAPSANFPELARHSHNPSYRFRGHKADIYEGGHRVPFVARWPGHIKPGGENHQVICLTDLLATVAEITGATTEPSTGVDSYSLLSALLGETDQPVREATVHHSVNGSYAIRKGPWKLILCPGSGGWSDPRPESPGIDKLPPFQLYNLDQDIGETGNLLEQYPEVVEELTTLLKQYIQNGRSTPGPRLDNVPSESWPGLNWMAE
ncbi:MAG: arylsulfatase [Bacteroidales bacterium]|nr:arylsulfatase [Bacteroidales bacterium]